MKLVIVGNCGGTNVGGSFVGAAHELDIDVCLVESRKAMEAPFWLRSFNWKVRGRRPTWLGRFSRRLAEKVRSLKPDWLITTGPAPCDRKALQTIRALGVRTLNYSTDDPFNMDQRAPWFLDALPLYDYVFSPRRANLRELVDLGCRNVSYLPFAYDPRLQFAELPIDYEEKKRYISDVLFVGGADHSRAQCIRALVDAGFGLALYGDYWDMFPETRGYGRGHADPSTLRKATSATKVALCLARRANRDGHVMRSFEIPAIGACMLAEDTEEHREIFGRDGEAVVYFRHNEDMLSKLRCLLEHDAERRRFAEIAHHLIVEGGNTYRDRLATMLHRAKSPTVQSSGLSR